VAERIAERPWIGSYERVGPDIEAPGWRQRYSSPYIRSENPADYYPSYPLHDLRGRHPLRTQPRELSLYVAADPTGPRDALSPTLVQSAPDYAHGVSGFGLEPSSLLYALGALLAIR